MTQRRSREQLRHDRAEREGRGSGHREDYQPYFQVRRGDFASRGRSSVTPSLLFDRSHETLSDLEREALNCLQLLNPSDIREQYSLTHGGVEREFEGTAPFARGTVEIAKHLDVAHPAFPNRELKRMTTDFVVTRRRQGIFAVHVKYNRELDTSRNAELRSIERAYWEDRHVKFCIYNETVIDRKAKTNLSLMQTFRKRPMPLLEEHILRQVISIAKHTSMMRTIEKIATRNKRNVTDVIDQVKYAVATGRLILNLSSRHLAWDELWPPITLNLMDEEALPSELALLKTTEP